MSAVRFGQLVGELSPFFDRVDVRFACFRKEDDWINYAASIRFLCTGTSTVQQAKPIVTPYFRTCYAGGTMEDDWKDFQQAFASGKVQLQGLTVTMQPSADLDSLICNLTKYSTYFTERQWPEYSGATSRRDAGPDQETIDRASFDIRKLGYRDIYQAISTCLQVYRDQSTNAGYDIFVSLPVYVKVDSIAFDGSTLTSMISFHDRFNSSRLIVHLLPGGGWGPRSGPLKEVYELSLKSTEAEKLGNSINRVTLSTKLREAGIDDQIDCRLLLGGLILDEESHQVSRLLLKHPNKLFGVEFPLLSVLDRFCSVEELSKLLLTPEEVKKKNPAKVFERAVSWLLASSGTFCVLRLDEYERLNIKDTKFTKGTVDLLAYAPQYSAIYAISCTVTIPQDKEIASIKECSEYLSKELFGERHVKLHPVLVTTKTDTSRAREDCIKRGVQLVDGNDMKGLVAKLHLGDAKDFRGLWGLY